MESDRPSRHAASVRFRPSFEASRKCDLEGGGGSGRNCRMFTRPVFDPAASLLVVCMAAVRPAPVLGRAPFLDDCARKEEKG